MKIILTFLAQLWHPAVNHVAGVVPDLRMSDMGKEWGFLVFGLLSELPGYREVLDVPANVITTRAFFIARNNQNAGGNMMEKHKAPNPELSKMFTRTADLSHVWDCRCEIEKFSQCITAVHILASSYLNEDVMAPFCVLLCVFAEKLEECNVLLSKTLDQALEAKNETN
jgi:hypothetical protein